MVKQVVPKNICSVVKKKKKVRKIGKRTNISKQKYGTSKLELDFARDFLDKNGILYIYQYEAKDIKRFFDFAISCHRDKGYIMEEKEGLRCVRQENQFFDIDLLVEIDGSYYHADPRVVSEDKIKPMHKHNKFVDGLKDKWAGMHCIPLLRIWEYDIRNNPKKVEEELSKYVKLANDKKNKKDRFKKPH